DDAPGGSDVLRRLVSVRDLLEVESGSDWVAEFSGSHGRREVFRRLLVGGFREVIVAEKPDADVLDPQRPVRDCGGGRSGRVGCDDASDPQDTLIQVDVLIEGDLGDAIYSVGGGDEHLL